MVSDELQSELSLSFIGCGRVLLDNLDFRFASARHDEQDNVDRLLRIFKKGCYRHDPDHFVPVVVNKDELQRAVAELELSFADLAYQSPPFVDLPRGMKLRCLHGRHRLLAASQHFQHFERTEKWWGVKFYDTMSPHVEESLKQQPNMSLKYCDGDIFRYYRQYRHSGNEDGRIRWELQLSRTKHRNLVQLERSNGGELIKPLDELLSFSGLWPGLSLGSYNRILPMRCFEEIACYLRRIRDIWSDILGNEIEPTYLDAKTVKLIELLCPEASSSDADHIRQLMLQRSIFPAVRDEVQRQRILDQLLRAPRILTIRTFTEDMMYLQACHASLVQLLPDRAAIKEGFRSAFASCFAFDRKYFLANFTELCLRAMRHFHELCDLPCCDVRKDNRRPKPPRAKIVAHRVQELAFHAHILGFRSGHISRILLCCANPPFLDQPSSQLPQWTSDLVDVETKLRCNRPTQLSLRRDSKHMFPGTLLQYVELPQNSFITTLFVVRDIFRSFFGQTPPDFINDDRRIQFQWIDTAEPIVHDPGTKDVLMGNTVPTTEVETLPSASKRNTSTESQPRSQLEQIAKPASAREGDPAPEEEYHSASSPEQDFNDDFDDLTGGRANRDEEESLRILAETQAVEKPNLISLEKAQFTQTRGQILDPDELRTSLQVSRVLARRRIDRQKTVGIQTKRGTHRGVASALRRRETLFPGGLAIRGTTSSDRVHQIATKRRTRFPGTTNVQTQDRRMEKIEPVIQRTLTPASNNARPIEHLDQGVVQQREILETEGLPSGAHPFTDMSETEPGFDQRVALFSGQSDAGMSLANQPPTTTYPEVSHRMPVNTTSKDSIDRAVSEVGVPRDNTMKATHAKMDSDTGDTTSKISPTDTSQPVDVADTDMLVPPPLDEVLIPCFPAIIDSLTQDQQIEADEAKERNVFPSTLGQHDVRPIGHQVHKRGSESVTAQPSPVQPAEAATDTIQAKSSSVRRRTLFPGRADQEMPIASQPENSAEVSTSVEQVMYQSSPLIQSTSQLRENDSERTVLQTGSHGKHAFSEARLEVSGNFNVSETAMLGTFPKELNGDGLASVPSPSEALLQSLNARNTDEPWLSGRENLSSTRTEQWATRAQVSTSLSKSIRRPRHKRLPANSVNEAHDEHNSSQTQSRLKEHLQEQTTVNTQANDMPHDEPAAFRRRFSAAEEEFRNRYDVRVLKSGHVGTERFFEKMLDHVQRAGLLDGDHVTITLGRATDHIAGDSLESRLHDAAPNVRRWERKAENKDGFVREVEGVLRSNASLVLAFCGRGQDGKLVYRTAPPSAAWDELFMNKERARLGVIFLKHSTMGAGRGQKRMRRISAELKTIGQPSTLTTGIAKMPMELDDQDEEL